MILIITDWALGEDRLLAQLTAAEGAGVEMAVQHRNPGVPARVYFEQAKTLKARLLSPLFLSARVDMAVALDTHLHLPSWAVLPVDARVHLPGKRISVSVHDEEESTRTTGADFALVSPVFSKNAIGIHGFRRLAKMLPCPAYALGGVTGPVPHAAGLAVISHVLHAADPAAAMRSLVDQRKS